MVVNTTLSFILAGGKGSRLAPLTNKRAKPAVPFAGSNRLIDFVLSNHINSGMRKIFVTTQYAPYSLHEHIRFGFEPLLGNSPYNALTILPAVQQKDNETWYLGTADSVTRHLSIIKEHNGEIVTIFGADHVYFMNMQQMISYHLDHQADLTIAALPVAVELAKGTYGVLKVNENNEILSFEEKPQEPSPLPHYPTHCFASMGNYVFSKKVLEEILEEDKQKQTTQDKKLILADPEKYSSHDFGYDVIPALQRKGAKIMAYNLFTNELYPGKKAEYWRDVGSIDQYFLSHMELLQQNPPLDLFDPQWPLHTYQKVHAPTKILTSGRNILAGNGVMVEGRVEHSVLGSRTIVEKGAYIEHSILLGNVVVGEGSIIKDAIIDKNVLIPPNTSIGVEKSIDKQRGFYAYEDHYPVVPEDYRFDK